MYDIDLIRKDFPILDRTVYARSATKRVVVLHNDFAIFGDADINLESFDACIEAALECAECVLHTLATTSTVCQEDNFALLCPCSSGRNHKEKCSDNTP